MSRTIAAIGIVVVLLVALILVLVTGGDGATSTTVPESSTVPTTTPATTTTRLPTTTAPVTTSPVDRETEIEEIIQSTQLRWYQALYEGDVEALGSVVATEPLYLDALDEIREPTIEFVAAPSSTTVATHVTEVLLDRADCLVVEATDDVTDLLNSDTPVTVTLFVLWPRPSGMYSYANRYGAGTPESIWLEDCDLADRGFEP